MKNSAHRGIQFVTTLPVLIFLSLFISCVSNNTANQNANKDNNTAQIAEAPPVNASDDIEALGKIVKLPYMPEDVFWQEESGSEISQEGNKITDPAARKLQAVLKFKDQDAEALAAQAAKISPPADATLVPEEWFPPELVAQGDTAGDQSLKGKQYSARDFLQPPYLNGKLIKLEQPGYFVLELTTY
jgi:hypothetical protein